MASEIRRHSISTMPISGFINRTSHGLRHPHLRESRPAVLPATRTTRPDIARSHLAAIFADHDLRLSAGRRRFQSPAGQALRRLDRYAALRHRRWRWWRRRSIAMSRSSRSSGEVAFRTRVVLRRAEARHPVRDESGPALSQDLEPRRAAIDDQDSAAATGNLAAELGGEDRIRFAFASAPMPIEAMASVTGWSRICAATLRDDGPERACTACGASEH